MCVWGVCAHLSVMHVWRSQNTEWVTRIQLRLLLSNKHLYPVNHLHPCYVFFPMEQTSICSLLAYLLGYWLSSFFLPLRAMEAPLRWLVLPLRSLPGFVWHPLYFSSRVVQITSKYSHNGNFKTCTKVENLLPSHHPASTIINPRAIHFYLALMLKQIQYIVSFYQ